MDLSALYQKCGIDRLPLGPGQLARSLGCGLVFAVEAAHYILANCGISLLSQTWLPFFSSGLRASLVTYVFAGLLLSVRRFQDVAGTGHRG